MDNQVYFAARKATDVAADLTGRAKDFYTQLQINEYMDKISTCWRYYFGAYYSDVADGHKISFGGEQGEQVNLPINHLRNIAQNMLVITTSNRPAMMARATNTDYKSFVQTKLANGLLDYYMRDKRLERFLKTAVEYAIVMGVGYLKMEWDATAGEVYDIDPETGKANYEGDVRFSNPTPLDVIFDTTKESSEDHEWVLVRSFKNKFNLAAKYKDLADEILAAKTKFEGMSSLNMLSTDKTDDIPVYEFFHKKCDALPDGRYVLFIDGDTVLIDSPMPYRNLPIYRVSPSEILGTPFGYTPIFDLLPIQEAMNGLYSTVATNQTAFGVQNVLVPQNANINFSQLGGGLNVLEYNSEAGKPEPLNLTYTPQELFSFMKDLERLMETLSGVNSVARGNPESSLKSGTALALVQAMAIQFMSGLQQSYIQLIEDSGTGLINMLKDFATVKRVAAIVGKSNRSYLKEFTGDNLSQISRVIVDAGNPLASTIAGRMQLAEQLVQYQVLKNPEHIIHVLNTGKLDVLADEQDDEMLLVDAENESLLDGIPVPTTVLDQHSYHIKRHKSLINDPELRKDPQLVQLVLSHIQEHINLLQTADPSLMQLIGEQPIPPPMPPQEAPPPESGPMATPEAAGTAVAPPPESPMELNIPGVERNVNLPTLPQAPEPFQDLPVTVQGR